MDSALPVVQFVRRPGILDLGWGHPRPALLPVEAWAAATAAVMRRPDGWQGLAYGPNQGPGPLIEWLAGHLPGVDAVASGPAEFYVTAGASHALALALAVLTEPGDTVLVDSPTYYLAFQTILDAGCRLVAAPVDQDGPDPDGLAGAAALYLVPTFGNPTGRSLPDGRRRRLVEAAREAGITIIEDDTYREVHYGTAAPPSLWSLSGGRGVVRIGSFSKTVAPGLRLGWINAAPDVIERLGRLGYVESGGGVNHFNGYVMAEFGASGGYAGHLGAARLAYGRQRDALVDRLRERLPGMATPRPDGGWFVWLPLPEGVTAAALLPEAERRGVSFLPGSRFHAGGRGGDGHIRLSFSMLAEEELAEAADRLADAIEAAG